MRRLAGFFAVCCLSPIIGHAQVSSTSSVRLTTFTGLTTTTVIDNRSPSTRANNIHLIQATGSGTWSVQLQYSDTASTGPWTNFTDPTSVVSNTSLASTGGAFGYHEYIRLSVTGTATVNYSGTQNLYVPFGAAGGGGGSGPLLETNSSPNIDQTVLNLQNSTFNGLTVSVVNASGGNVQFGLSGTLNNSGLANSSFAVVVPPWLTSNGPIPLGGTLTLSAATGQTPGQVVGTCGIATSVGLCALQASDIPAALSNSTSVNHTTIPASQTLVYAGGPLGTPASGIGTNLTGIPLGTGILATFSPPFSLSGNTLGCPNCVNASSPGAGIAHFAGSTQTVTSSPVSLTADVTGVLPAANLPVATSSALGVVQPDGTTLTVSGPGVLSCAVATTGQAGCVKPDGTTITISGGVISSGSGMSIGGAIGGSATPGDVLYVGALGVLAQEVHLGASRFPALTGDLASAGGTLSVAVVGINSVALCTGFSPVNGQTVEYTTGSSPNPCWGAASIVGGGNMSTSGTPAIHQVGVFASGTTMEGVAGPAGAGVPFLSGGTGVDPAFAALNLAGGSAIVNGLLPGANGGTGVNNGTSTLTYAANVAFSGAYSFTATLTGPTNVTFPTSGPLGTVTSVGFTGGIISVGTPTTTPAFTVAGTSGGIPCFTATNAWASSGLQTSGQFMLGGGAGACPSTSFSIVPMANGGSAANLTPSLGGLIYSTGSAMAVLAGTATANQIPMSGASAAPAWSTATYPPTTTINQILYSSANNVITGLATANNAVVCTSGGGVPSLCSALPATFEATGSTFGIVKPDNTTITVVGGVISAAAGSTSATFLLSNDGTTGTTSGTLTKATSAGAAIKAATTDVNGIIGITSSGAGTTGNATVTYAGAVSCVFDGATTAGDYVTISTTTAGDCHDAGAIPPSGQVIGRIWGTNGSGGPYTIDLFPASTPPLSVGQGLLPSYSAAGMSISIDSAYVVQNTAAQYLTPNTWYGASYNTSTHAYTGGTITPAPGAFVDGSGRPLVINFCPGATNTTAGATSVDFGAGPKPLYEAAVGTTNPIANDFQSGACYLITYDASIGTGAFTLQSLPGNPLSASSIAMPITVSGTVNSGGVPYFNSGTQMSSSAALGSTCLVVGGGSGAAPATGNCDFTYATHTLAGGASAILDMSAASVTTGVKLPSAAGAAPTADGYIAINTTTHLPAFGSNGGTITPGFLGVAGTWTAAQALGSSTATTQTAGDNSTKLATTQYVDGKIAYTNPQVNVDSSLSTSTGAGMFIPGTSLTAGDAYYYGSSGLALAEANASSTAPADCIAISTTQCMVTGVYRFSASQSWTAGQQVYLSDAAAGALVTTAPTTSGHFVQVLGKAIAADTILWRPSPDVGGIQ